MLPKIPRKLECNGRLPPLPAHPPPPPPHPRCTPPAPEGETQGAALWDLEVVPAAPKPFN